MELAHRATATSAGPKTQVDIDDQRAVDIRADLEAGDRLLAEEEAQKARACQKKLEQKARRASRQRAKREAQTRNESPTLRRLFNDAKGTRAEHKSASCRQLSESPPPPSDQGEQSAG